MHVGASSGKEARTESCSDLDPGPAKHLGVDTSFAVIHDEPFITIVYENGEFLGQIVDASLDRLEEARAVASRYNLIIDHVRCDYHSGFSLHLTEREVHDSN